jgi:hypothetical protein
MSEYERLVQDRRDADRARHNDWKARALAAEAALREIARIAKYGESDWGAIHFTTIANIARAALEGKSHVDSSAS